MCVYVRESRVRARERASTGWGAVVFNLTFVSSIGLNLFHLNPHLDQSSVVFALEFLTKLTLVHCLTQDSSS